MTLKFTEGREVRVIFEPQTFYLSVFELRKAPYGADKNACDRRLFNVLKITWHPLLRSPVSYIYRIGLHFANRGHGLLNKEFDKKNLLF